MTMKRFSIWLLALAVAGLPVGGSARVEASSPNQPDKPAVEAASVSSHPAPTVVEQRAFMWNPSAAAVLSLVIPGAGQMYKGQVRSGFLWLGAVALGYMTFIVPGVVLHVLCVISAAQGDPMTPGRWV
jgi:TM2 domain-containing membrane protein YozV